MVYSLPGRPAGTRINMIWQSVTSVPGPLLPGTRRAAWTVGDSSVITGEVRRSRAYARPRPTGSAENSVSPGSISMYEVEYSLTRSRPLPTIVVEPFQSFR